MAYSHKQHGCAPPVEPFSANLTTDPRKAREMGNIFPIDFLLEYDTLNPVDYCVWGAGACSRFSFLGALTFCLSRKHSF
jgi:hypothetical protein